MNDTLSTLIAFVGVLIVFSMLTQSVQEALKNLLSLKAGVWESFWRCVYRTEFGLEGTGDAKTAPKTGATVQTQPQGLLARARSLFVYWGGRKAIGSLEQRLKQVQVNVTTAIELVGKAKSALKEIADPNLVAAAPDVVTAKRQALTAALSALASLKLGALFNIYKKLDGNNTIPTLDGKLATFLAESVDKALADVQVASMDLLKIIDNTEQKLSEYGERLRHRYDAWMAQVNAAYRGHMLFVTLLIGAAFVLLFNADAFSIYRRLASSPQARAAAITHAEEVVKLTVVSKAEDLNTIRATIEAKEPADAKTMASAFCAKLAQDFKKLKDNDGAERANAIKTIIDKLPGTESDLPVLGEQQPELVSLFLRLNTTTVDSFAREVTALDLPLGWRQDYQAFEDTHGGWPVLWWLLLKFSGLALTLFLITLGAPFWNDVLAALVGVKNLLGNRAKPTS